MAEALPGVYANKLVTGREAYWSLRSCKLASQYYKTIKCAELRQATLYYYYALGI